MTSSSVTDNCMNLYNQQQLMYSSAGTTAAAAAALNNGGINHHHHQDYSPNNSPQSPAAAGVYTSSHPASPVQSIGPTSPQPPPSPTQQHFSLHASSSPQLSPQQQHHQHQAHPATPQSSKIPDIILTGEYAAAADIILAGEYLLLISSLSPLYLLSISSLSPLYHPPPFPLYVCLCQRQQPVTVQALLCCAGLCCAVWLSLSSTKHEISKVLIKHLQSKAMRPKPGTKKSCARRH